MKDLERRAQQLRTEHSLVLINPNNGERVHFGADGVDRYVWQSFRGRGGVLEVSRKGYAGVLITQDPVAAEREFRRLAASNQFTEPQPSR